MTFLWGVGGVGMSIHVLAVWQPCLSLPPSLSFATCYYWSCFQVIVEEMTCFSMTFLWGDGMGGMRRSSHETGSVAALPLPPSSPTCSPSLRPPRQPSPGPRWTWRRRWWRRHPCPSGRRWGPSPGWRRRGRPRHRHRRPPRRCSGCQTCCCCRGRENTWTGVTNLLEQESKNTEQGLLTMALEQK